MDSLIVRKLYDEDVFKFYFKSFLLFKFELIKAEARAVGHASARGLGQTFVPRFSHVKCKQKFKSLPSRCLSQIHIYL